MTVKKNVLNALMAISLMCGCSEEYDRENKPTGAWVPKTPLILIGKERSYQNSIHASSNYGVLFFATEEQTNKVAFVAYKLLPCAKSEAKFFEAKIGDKKMPDEWRKALSHPGEDRYGYRKQKHGFGWSYVRED